MRIDELPGDRQPQTRATAAAVPRAIGPGGQVEGGLLETRRELEIVEA